MSLVAAVEREIGRLPSDLADSAVAATALAMAERIDGRQGSPSECGKVLLQALETLRALAPPKQEMDELDELRERRKQRREGLAKASDMPRS